MFSLAILIGIYSYLILALGLLGLFYKSYLVILTLGFWGVFIYFYKEDIGYFLNTFLSHFRKKNRVIYIVLAYIIIQVVVNAIGALGPETAFDALWYHLTLPKMYLQNHAITFIPGGLLYYSTMPQLTEMLYAAAVAIQGETLAKLIHFSFGILSCIALYSLSRKFISSFLSLIAVVVFYSNLLVAWESITAYVDLARTFFEIMALWGFINWIQTKQKKWLIESSVMIGLGISAKLLSLGSMGIFTILLIIFSQPKSMYKIITNILVYWYTGILVVVPWLVFSFVHTGTPVYPFFTDIYKTVIDFSLLNPLRFFNDVFGIFTNSSDPLSPLYIVSLPLIIIFLKRFKKETRPILWYCLLSLFVWYISPPTGGGRFILPYVPAYAILIALTVNELRKIKTIYFSLCLFLILSVSFTSIIYRGVANAKYIPVILGLETKDHFLINNLNFSFGDFYDTDNYFKNNVSQDQKVLLYGFHNLYYVDFPFIDSSWVQKGDRFSYIATQNSELPEKFKNWNLIYQNQKTHVRLYSNGGKQWAY